MNKNKKNGFTILEVIITIAVAGIFITVIYSLAGFIMESQFKRVQRQNGIIIIESLNANYLNDPASFDVPNKTKYFDMELKETLDPQLACYILTYSLDVDSVSSSLTVYDLTIIELKCANSFVLFRNIVLGKWVKIDENA